MAKALRMTSLTWRALLHLQLLGVFSPGATKRIGLSLSPWLLQRSFPIGWLHLMTISMIWWPSSSQGHLPRSISRGHGSMQSMLGMRRLSQEPNSRQTAQKDKQMLQSQLVSMMVSCPSLRKMIKLPSPASSSVVFDDSLRSQLTIRLSILPPSLCSQSGTMALVARFSASLARTLQNIQQEVCEQLMVPPALHLEPYLGYRTAVHCSHWDQTMQRMRNPNRLPKLKSSSEQVRIQTMVQSGKIDIFVFGSQGEVDVRNYPWFARSIYLWRQTANFLIEGLLRHAPFRVDNIGQMSEISSPSDVVVLSFSRDGAIANTLTLDRFWDQSPHTTSRNILPYSHLCSLNRAVIARSRVKGFASVAAAFHSCTRFIRVDKHMEGLVSSVHQVVSERLIAVRAPRPEKYQTRASKLIDVLFKSDDDDDYMYKKLADGGRKPTDMHDDLAGLLKVIDLRMLGDEGRPRLAHCCWVLEGSVEHTEHGMPCGGPCCTSDEESLDKILAPIQTWLTGRGWVSMVLGRWTHATATMRRALMVCLGPCNVLVEALDHLPPRSHSRHRHRRFRVPEQAPVASHVQGAMQTEHPARHGTWAWGSFRPLPSTTSCTPYSASIGLGRASST
mmetsp:Transcript_117353/g.373922  ORF Transcript_117353/g.373922 Transcript_117353/m.373922 type:complete len:616 (+) Transcript_117353:59-1906(+)